jgi:hypothetical protein
MLAVKVFSATKSRDREFLGEKITDYLRWSKAICVDKRVVQSSDAEYHCISVVLFMVLPDP